MSNSGRDITKTNDYSDFDLAVKFHRDFDVNNNFGAAITNTEFEDWIISLRIPHMIRIGHTSADRQSWNNYRTKIRQYIKNGVLTSDYKEGGFGHPFCLDINEHGHSIRIIRLEESVIHACNDLTRKRKANIQYQNRAFKKDFDGILNLFAMDKVEAIMQQHLLEAHNRMRISMEQTFGDIMHTTVGDTLRAISESQRQVQELSLFKDEDFDNNRDRNEEENITKKKDDDDDDNNRFKYRRDRE